MAGIGALWVVEPGAGAAQEPFPEPTFITLLNLTDRFHTVDIDQQLPDGGSFTVNRLAVQPQEPVTFLFDAGPNPQDLVAACGGCRPAPFAIAAGQRIVVLLVGLSDPALPRSDLHVVNESGVRQRGVVRTGAAVGTGRTLLPFDLRDGESVRVGLRLPRGPIDLNLTCARCDAQQIRLGNGVDLEVVIR